MGLYKDTSFGDVRLTENLRKNDGNQYISYRIRNNKNEDTRAKMVITHYDTNGKLVGIISEKSFNLSSDSTTRIISDALPIAGKTGQIRAVVWSDDGNLYPLTPKNNGIIN